MTHEANQPTNQPPQADDQARRLADYYRQQRPYREARLVHMKEVGADLDATLVAVRDVPPGVSEVNPAIYRHNPDGFYFVVYGNKDEVAGTEESAEVQATRRWRVVGKPEVLGNYAIGHYDLEHRIEQGARLYTPEGYLEHQLYTPATDPPLLTPSSPSSRSNA